MEEIRQLIEELEEKLNLDVKELIITISISTQCRKESSKEKEWSSYNWVGLGQRYLPHPYSPKSLLLIK
jgi:hypothetical protein